MNARTRILSAGTAALVAGALGLIPAAAANAAPAGSATPAAAAAALPAATTLPVTGTLNNAPFAGSLSNLSTSVVDGVLQLSGTITGAGIPAGTTFTAPIQDLNANGACDILNLDLGPLDLNVLGLQVDLAPVVLDITAVPGAGNLLGNLLCAVAGLLDGNGALTSVSALLNRILTGLGL